MPPTIPSGPQSTLPSLTPSVAPSGFQPLTPQQYQAARSAGFSPEKIIQNEQVRKSQSQPAQPGLIQSLAAGIAQPFARLGTNLEGAALGLKSLGQIGNQTAFNQTQQQIQDLKTNGQNLPVVGNVKPVGQTADFGQNVKDAVGTGLQVESVLAPYGKVAKLGTELTAPLLGGLGSRLAGTALSGAAGGYAADVGTNLSQNKPVGESLTPGLGTALGAVIPAGAEAGIEGAQALRSGLGNSAPRVINSLIKPLLKDFSYGKNPGRTVAKLGITGNSLDQLGENISQARQAIGQQAAEESQKIPQATIYLGKSLNPLDEAITKAAANNNPTVVQRLKDVKDAITKNLVLNKDGEITSAGTKSWYQRGNASYLDGLEAKQKVGELTKFTGNHSDDKDVNMALKKVYGSIKEALDKGATKADPEVAAKLRSLNEQYADLKSAEIATKYRDKIESRQNLIGFTPTVAGIGTAVATLVATGGAALPAVLAGISGAVIDKALSSPAFKTRLASWLAKLAPAERELVVQKFPQLARLPFPGDNLDKVPQKLGDYLEKHPPSLGLALKDVNKMSPAERAANNIPEIPKALGGGPKNAEPFQGFSDITTNVLDDLKGRTTVSKTYITDALNRQGIPKAEKDAFTAALDSVQGEKVNVKDFADAVKTELLPLERVNGFPGNEKGAFQARYNSVSLPDDLRGPVADYAEHVYNSPIETDAGGVHFNTEQNPGYFAHTRTEDLGRDTELPDGTAQHIANGDTRRVIEVQSDLFQKGRLEREAGTDMQARINTIEGILKEHPDREKEFWNELDRARAIQEETTSRAKELAKLKPYENTWQDRIVRGEVKQAALDGKTKLQFPTGETAMKIEGLGTVPEGRWTYSASDGSTYNNLTVDDLKIGREVNDGNTDWIITDVLGDGKFKAVPKDLVDDLELAKKYQTDGEDVGDLIKDNERNIENAKEQFDISGSVDKQNPIYKFYEGDMRKFLQKKYGAKLITDPQGVTWYELDVPKEAGSQPVKAFGKIKLGTALGGAAAGAAALSARPQPLKK